MTEMKNHRRDRAEKMMAKYACGGSVASSKDDGEPDMDTSSRQGKKRGGHVEKHEAEGHAAKKRLDKRKRYASGGGVDDVPKEKKGAKTQVNVIIAGGDKGAASAPPISAPPPMMPPGPPAGAPMIPPGAPPMPIGRKRGGSVMMKDPKYPITDGAGGGLGRLEKAAAARKTHKRGGKI